MVLNKEILDSIEDVIAENSASPDKLSIELENIKNTYSLKDILESLDNDSLFGDPKLTAIVRGYFTNSKQPIDSAYIKSLDFCECEVCKAIQDVEKLTVAEDIFRTTCAEPLFLTDSGTYKHELIKDFEFPKVFLTNEQEILQSDDLAELCSPTVISLIAHSNGKEYTEDMTTKELLEYINNIKNFSESSLGKLLTGSGDFSFMNKVRSLRGVKYLQNLLNRRAKQANNKNSRFQKPKGMSLNPEMKPYEQWLQEGDFNREEPTDLKEIKGSNAVRMYSGNADGYGLDTGISSVGSVEDDEPGTGDIAQKRGGTSGVKKDLVKSRRESYGKK